MELNSCGGVPADCPIALQVLEELIRKQMVKAQMSEARLPYPTC